MKKLIFILITCIFVCTACYPTGENPIRENNIQSLTELNTSNLSNVEFDFSCDENYNNSYPLLTARWKSTGNMIEKIEEIFLYNENKGKYNKKEENLPSVRSSNANTYTIYDFNNNGYLLYDTGCIGFIKDSDKCELNGYLEIDSCSNVLLTSDNMRRYFNADILDDFDYNDLVTKSNEIINSFSIPAEETPEAYAVDKNAIQNLPYGQPEVYENFSEDDEAYILHYRQMFEGLPLTYFRTHSNAREAQGIKPLVSFVYSREGLEYFDADLIEITEKGNNVNVCPFIEAAASVKNHIENLYSENNEQITVNGGELNYISEVDYNKNTISLKPVWIFTKESKFEDNTPYFEPIIIDAANAQLYD